MRSTPNTRVSDFLLPDIGYAKVLGMFREVEGSYQFTVNTHIPFRPTPPLQPDWSRITSDKPYAEEAIARSHALTTDWFNIGGDISVNLCIGPTLGRSGLRPGLKPDSRIQHILSIGNDMDRHLEPRPVTADHSRSSSPPWLGLGF